MATWILINTVTINGTKLLPGHTVDDAAIPVATVTAAGGELWPSSDAVVAAMATQVQSAHVNKGMNEAEMESRMRASSETSLLVTGSKVFIYQQGGTAGKGVYTDWPSLVTAVASVNGDRTVIVDATFAANGALGIPACIVPAGAWNFSPAGITGYVRLVGFKPDQGSPVTLQTAVGAAVSINGVREIVDLLVDNRSTLDLFTMLGAQAAFTLRGEASAVHSISAAGAAFIRCSTNGSIFISDLSRVQSFDGGTNAIQHDGGTLTVLIANFSSIAANMLAKQGGSGSTIVYISSVYGGITPYGAQASASGVVPQWGRQKGTATIDGSTGKSAAIPATISATTTILVTLKTPATDAATAKYAVLDGDRVNGAGGTFKISALTSAGGGALNAADTSTLMWEAIN